MTELLAVMPIALIMLTGVGMVLMATVRSQSEAVARSSATVETRNALERMTRELRGATVVAPVPGASGQVVDFQKCTDASCNSKLWVRYSCTGKPAATCTRYETASVVETDLDTPAVAATGRVLVANVTDPAVFDFIGSFDANGDPQRDLLNPIYMTVKLSVGVAPDGGAETPKNPVELSDGVELRNVNLGLS